MKDKEAVIVRSFFRYGILILVGNIGEFKNAARKCPKTAQHMTQCFNSFAALYQVRSLWKFRYWVVILEILKNRREMSKNL